MRTFLIVSFLTLVGSIYAADYPTTVLKNGTVTMTVRPPDSKVGFYRSTRFDWAGVIGPVEVLGKKLFLPWKDSHNPENNDDITGPVDEFGMYSPLGFAGAKDGGRFVKIGVGELKKGNDAEYAFWKKYEIAKAPVWTVTTSPTEMTFRQKYAGDLGYGYDYSKSIELGENGFQLKYVLKNTGKQTINTDVYNHNFFNVAGASTGKGFAVKYAFPAKLKEPKERFNDLAKLTDRTVSLTGELDKGSIYTLIEGFGDDKDAAKFAIEGGGIRMTVTGDRPLSKVALWGVKQTLCPEPFIAITLTPGESMAWSWVYAFEVVK